MFQFCISKRNLKNFMQRLCNIKKSFFNHSTEDINKIHTNNSASLSKKFTPFLFSKNQLCKALWVYDKGARN